MIFKDYYKILGLETNKVNIDEIKLAYREQAKKYHPDVNIGDKRTEERFKDINEAYKVLSVENSRRKYDRMWNNHIGSKKRKSYQESRRNKDSLFSDFFNMFFGKNENIIKDDNISKSKKVPIKGENIETQVNVSIEEAFYGAQKKISLRTVEGKIKTFSIKVPAGIRNKEKIRLLGQGKPGKNGANNGDLFIRINIENSKKFRLDGYDIHTDLLLTPWEAALGTRVNVEGIEESASLYVPRGIQSGERVRMPGKGYRDGKGGNGDLVAEVKIVVPKNISQKEEEIYKELEKISKFNPRI